MKTLVLMMILTMGSSTVWAVDAVDPKPSKEAKPPADGVKTPAKALTDAEAKKRLGDKQTEADYRGTSLADVATLLAKASDVPIDLADEVDGKLEIHFSISKCSVETILKLVCSHNDLTWAVKDGRVLISGPKAEEPKAALSDAEVKKLLARKTTVEAKKQAVGEVLAALAKKGEFELKFSITTDELLQEVSLEVKKEEAIDSLLKKVCEAAKTKLAWAVKDGKVEITKAK